MANPQPDIFIAWSKELWKAILKTHLFGNKWRVFGAIGLLTYGAIPRMKEAQITNEEIVKLTDLDKFVVSKCLKQLLKANLVVKNDNYRPPIMRINKDYDSWKELSKLTTSSKIKGSQRSQKKELSKMTTKVVKIDNSSKITPLNNIKKKKQIDFLYNFYKTEISPLRKSSTRAKENIHYYLKKYPFGDLKKSILNYQSTINGTEPQYRKDPANFFGKNDRYFVDYLPENFEEPKTAIEQDDFYQELK